MKTFCFATLLASSLTVSLMPPSAGAQTIYRCADSYSQTPCASGKLVDVDDSRTAQQRKDALADTARTAKTAQAMEKDRLRQEAAVAKANAPKPVAKLKAGAKPAPSAKMNKPRKPDYFTAMAPGDKPKKKAKKSKAAKETAAAQNDGASGS